MPSGDKNMATANCLTVNKKSSGDLLPMCGDKTVT